jgi:hypothetical protein
MGEGAGGRGRAISNCILLSHILHDFRCIALWKCDLSALGNYVDVMRCLLPAAHSLSLSLSHPPSHAEKLCLLRKPLIRPPSAPHRPPIFYSLSNFLLILSTYLHCFSSYLEFIKCNYLCSPGSSHWLL